MSNFKVELLRLSDVEPHPGADRLDLAIVGPKDTAYRCVVQKDRFKSGELVAYIPEGSILPYDLIEQMGLSGALAGAQKNRVKAVKIRGILSQGLVWKPEEGWDAWFERSAPLKLQTSLKRGVELPYEGADIAEALGITKYAPPIPVNMAGKMQGDAPAFSDHTDMENIKKYSELFKNGETVYVTEKIHGTQMSVIFDGETFKISSKGVLHKNRATLAEEAGNLYWQAFHNSGIERGIRALFELLREKDGILALQLVGEVYGKVQDLTYGMSQGHKFAAFDLRLCLSDNTPRYVDSADFFSMMSVAEIPVVPLLYVGPYSYEQVKHLTSGNTVAATVKQIREGVVVKPARERNDYQHGRVILKSISEDYLIRKGNVTEME
jgi:RNA ligase (TIGR02306 family)